MYIIDASVAIKWILQEEDSDKALSLCEQALYGNIEIAAPDMLLYEVTNILVRKMKLEPWQVEKAIRELLGTGIATSSPDAELMIRAAEIAWETGASVYDAAYVALALDQKATLVTADRRLARLVGSRADICMLDTF